MAEQPAPLATPAARTPLVITGDSITSLVAGDGAGLIFVTGERGLYRSSDAGDTWHAVGKEPPAPLLAIGDDERFFLAGTRVACGSAQTDATPLFRSRDGGASWQPVAGVERLWPLAIWGAPAVAVGATCGGLQVSTDEGLTWQSLNAIPADLGVRALARTPGQDGAGAFFVIGTAERGMSVLWLVILGQGGELVSSQALRTFWGTAAVGGSSNSPVVGTANGVLTSPDGGKTWRLSRTGLEEVTLSVDPTQGPIPDAELQRGYGITAVAASASHPDLLYVGTIAGVYRSGDGGGTWSKLEGTAGMVTALILTSRGTLLAESDAGVFEYTLPLNGHRACHGASVGQTAISPFAVTMASVSIRSANTFPEQGRSS
jgi:hypothetical protein